MLSKNDKKYIERIILLCFVLSYFTTEAQKPKTTTPAKTIAKNELTREVVTATNPAFISPIVSIPYKGVITPPSPALAKDQLLWYKGKKVNDSILITPDAKLILFSKPRNIVVVQTNAKQDPWLMTIKRMEAVDQDKKKLVDATADKPNNFFLYPHIKAAFKEYEEQNKDYANALKNVIPLPEALPTAAVKHYSTGGVASLRLVYFAGIPSAVKQAYEEIIQKKKNYPSLDFPAPPQKEFGACYQYDGIAQNQYAIDSYKWEQEFIKYEKDLVTRSLSVFTTMEELKLNTDPEAILIKTELDKVIEFSFARMKNKVDLLIRNYGKDFTRLPLVIRMAISVERQQQLMGGKDASGETIARLIQLLDGFDKYIEQQVAARNYDVVFNVAFMIGVERQRQLLGAEQKHTPADILYKKYMPFNRFKIDMEADFSYSCNEDDCQYVAVAGKLATKKDFYISLVPYQYGGFQIFLTNSIYKPEEEPINRELDYHGPETGQYDLELKASDGYRKTVSVDDNGNKRINTESLTGAEMLTHLPIGRIYFCKGKQDTLFLLGFYPKGGGTGGKAYSMHFDMNYMIANLSEEQLNTNTPKIIGDAEAYQKRMKAYEVEPTGFEKLDKQQNQYNIVEMYQKNAENIAKYALTKDAAVLFDAENGDPEIMDSKLDVAGKRIENIKIDKGIIKVKIVHDPLPYK